MSQLHAANLLFPADSRIFGCKGDTYHTTYQWWSSLSWNGEVRIDCLFSAFDALLSCTFPQFSLLII